MNLNGKTIVVTGAASGIGLALLQALCAFDVRILAADRDEAALHQAIASLPAPDKVQAYTGNLGSAAKVDELFDAAETVLGHIDVFVANAGFAYYEAFNGEWAHIEALYAVNVFSPLNALHHMQKRYPLRPFTFVITASSMAHLGLAGYALYGSTKAALDRFADAFRLEAPPSAHLMLVYPISTRSKFFDNGGNRAPVPWPTQSTETVAAAIVRGLEKDQKSVNPSRLFSTMRFLNRFVPVLRPYQQRSRRVFRKWRDRQSGEAHS